MSVEETAYLKSEIARLNKIINALLKYNDLLSAENAVLKNGNRENNTESAYHENINGNSEFKSAVPKIGNGINNSESALSKNWNGISDSESALSENEKGQSNVPDGIRKIGNGNPSARRPLPAYIEPSARILSVLNNLLIAHGMKRVKFSAVRNAALLLLHFHNQSGGSYAGLQKLTGLSNYGLAKFIRSLKKRNLIVRTGWQQFSITESGEALVRAAWEKSGMP